MKNLNDIELLDYLINSEFNEEVDLNPDEYKYLLHKWKYFYRLLYSRSDNLKKEIESKKNKIDKLEEKFKIQIIEIRNELNTKDSFISSLKNKKLTFKERLTGKIKIEYKNENK
jgi:hypothetical protein